MNRVLGWHTRVGDAGFRLAHLQLLWIVHTLLGGIVLGAYPATAAVLSVLRRDHMEEADWEGARDRPSLWREFHDVWRAELVGANIIGLVLTAGWAVVLYDHRLLRVTATEGVSMAAAPVLQWLLWILTLVLLVVTATVFVLRAHFADGPVRILRRSVVLTIARPVLALVCAGILGVTLGLYYVLPGLAVVFGVVAPAFAVMAYVWQTGVLPRPAASAALPAPAAPSASAPSAPSASSSASVSSPAPQLTKEPARV